MNLSKNMTKYQFMEAKLQHYPAKFDTSFCMMMFFSVLMTNK